MGYDGFISYSHGVDNQLAPAVQSAVQRLARPWYRTRALRVFRDESGLSVNPHLWSSIQEALDSSRYFILLASPEAAASTWVNRELEHWLKSNSADRVLPVLTAGTLTWDAERGDYDRARSTALPPVLRGRFRQEPRHLDLRWAHQETQLDLRHSRFRAAIAGLAAPMHGVAREELEGEDIRLHRRAVRLAQAAVLALALLTIGALTTGALAYNYAQVADAAAHRARTAEQSALHQAEVARAAQAEAGHQAALAQVAQASAVDEAGRERSARDLAATRQADAEHANLVAQQRAEAEALARRSAAASAVRAIAEKERADAAAAAEIRQALLAQRNAAAAKMAAAEARVNASAAEAAAADAREQATFARAGEIAAEARAVGAQPDLAMLLAAEAAALAPTAPARGALLSTVNQAPGLDLYMNGLLETDTINLSPDGRLLVARDRLGQPEIRVYETSTGQALPLQPPVPASDPTSAAALAFGPGNLLAYSSGLGLEIWNPRTGEASFHALPDAMSLGALTFSAGGTRLAISQGSLMDPWVLDLASGTFSRLTASNILATAPSPAKVLSGIPASCLVSTDAVALSPDSRYLAEPGTYYDAGSGNYRYEVMVWDLSVPGQTNPALALPVFDSAPGEFSPTNPLSLRFSEDSNRLTLVMAGLDQAALTYDVATGNVVSTVAAAAASAPGEILVGATGDLATAAWLQCDASTIRVRNFADGSEVTGAPIVAPPTLTNGFDPRVVLSDDGRYIFTRSKSSVQRWTVSRRTGLAATSTPLTGPPGAVGLLSANGRVAALVQPGAADAGTIIQLGSATRPLIIPGTPGAPGQVCALSADGTLAAVCEAAPGGLPRVTTRRTADGNVVGTPVDAGFSGVPTYSKDGRRFAAPVFTPGGPDLEIFDVTSGRHQVSIASPAGTFAFSPDGRFVAVIGDNSARLSVFDAGSGQRIATVPEEPIGVNSMSGHAIAFSPDGKRVVAGVSEPGNADSLLTWEAGNWKLLGNAINGPGMVARSVAFSPDSTSVLTDGGQLADVATGEVTATLPGFITGTVAFSADGTHALNITDAPALVDYDLSVAANRAAACAVANRDFTGAEAARYLGGIPDIACARP